MKEPVDHILRPRLPWRHDEAGITECGLDASKVKTLSRDEYFARLKDFGQQRCAMFTCMTCGDTARRWGTWEDDPRRALEREIMWEGGGGYRMREDRGERLKEELLAIAELTKVHRGEFEAWMRRRAWLEKKAAHQKARKPWA